MKSFPFITIGIASYNYAQYLEYSFQAIKVQNFKDFELLYVDDCSTDNSVDVINNIIHHNPDIPIRLIKNSENLGIMSTKNTIIQNARGQYLMLCDSDDWMAPNCLEELAMAAKINNADRVISEVADIDKNGKIVQVQKIPANPSPWLWNLHHGCLYKREILITNNIRIRYLPDDVYLTTRFNEYAVNTSWIPKVLYYWRIHIDSAGRKAENNRENIVCILKNAVRYIDESSIKMEFSDPDIPAILELLVTKIYYLYLYNGTRYFSLKDKLYCYGKMHHIMKSAHPCYLNNRLLRSEQSSQLRHYAYQIIRLSTMLEKLHIMPAALLFYHVVSKVYYFDQ